MRPKFLPAITRAMILSTVVFLTACSPKIDGTSFDSFQASLKKITADMPKEKAKEFDADLTTLMSRRNMTIGDLRGFVNGMTVDGVHKAAQETEALWKSQRAAQVKATIQELDQEEAKANVQKAGVAKFGITVNDLKGKWAYDPAGYDRPENRMAALTVTLQNNTGSTITEFGYDLTLAVDGREFSPDPWSYKLETPLAAGQRVTVQITDKGSDEAARSQLSSRVTEKIIDAVKENPNSALSAKLKLTSITTSGDVFLSANPATRSGMLADLRKELATLTEGAQQN